MSDTLMSEQTLQRSRLCSGLAAEELSQVAAAVRRVSYRSGESVCRQGERGDTMYIVAEGRLKVTVSHGGEQRLVDFLATGDHFGEMAMLSEGERTASVTAVTDTWLLELSTDDFHRLMAELPGFAANLGRTLCARLRRETMGREAEKHVGRIAVLQTSPRCRLLVPLLAEAIAAYGKSAVMLSDRQPLPAAGAKFRYEPVAEVGETTATAAELEPHDVGRVRRRGGELSAECDHLVLDLGLWRDDGALGVVLGDYEQIWVVVEACRWDETRRRLDDLLGRFPKLAPMTHLVWVLRDDERFAPAVEFPAGIVARDFKVVISEDSRRGSIYQRQGLTRLLRYIYGKRVGLALSGGGARGLAHLGALRVLDREGVFFDSIAGTSAGALMGLAYSGGWEPDDALAKFQRDLTPSWLFRRVPAGKRWYMLMKYRTGAWDRMLRTYAPEVRLEQLRIPLSTVAVDLVSGKQVVRDRGDAIHAVLESLNLPMISRPIVRRHGAGRRGRAQQSARQSAARARCTSGCRRRHQPRSFPCVWRHRSRRRTPSSRTWADGNHHAADRRSGPRSHRPAVARG
ncbi:MAG: cyclic nucleotide-binding and patatin-like phospholipase domain-containing protein [Pirellulales bacterium]